MQAHVMVEEAPAQRENAFMTKCKVNGDVYDLIIDSSSEANVVFVGLVKQVKLKTTRYHTLIN